MMDIKFSSYSRQVGNGYFLKIYACKCTHNYCIILNRSYKNPKVVFFQKVFINVYVNGYYRSKTYEMKNRYAMLYTYTEITTAKTIKLQYEKISFPAEESLVQKSVLHLQTSIPSMSTQPAFSPSSKGGPHMYNGSDPNLGPVIFPQVPSPQSTVFSANLSL